MHEVRKERMIFACIDRHYVRVFDQVLVGSRFIVIDRHSLRTIRLKDFVHFLSRLRPLI